MKRAHGKSLFMRTVFFPIPPSPSPPPPQKKEKQTRRKDTLSLKDVFVGVKIRFSISRFVSCSHVLIFPVIGHDITQGEILN